MEKEPQSPEDVIDPRWGRYLDAQPQGQHSTEAAAGRHAAPSSTPLYPTSQEQDLGERMRAIVLPWLDGQTSARAALRALADLERQQPGAVD